MSIVTASSSAWPDRRLRGLASACGGRHVTSARCLFQGSKHGVHARISCCSLSAWAAFEWITCLHVHLTGASSACFPRRYLRWRTVLTVTTCVAAFVYAFHLMMPIMADALATQPALADTRNGLANIGTSGLISTLLFFQVRGLHRSAPHL